MICKPKHSASAFVWNIAVVYLCYVLCRIAFVVENWATYADTLFLNTWRDLIVGSWMFDTSAILYTNALVALLMLFPLHWLTWKPCQLVTRVVYVLCNGLCIVANLIDTVYFQYTGRRTTTSVFSEFGAEGNLGSIMGIEVLHHWYLVLLAVALIWLLWRLYAAPMPVRLTGIKNYLRYYLVALILFLIYLPLTVIGMRGGATTAVRPITISNANQYVNRPAEAAVILNTPFSMIRTLGKTTFRNPEYFTDDELDTFYSPVHPALNDSVVETRQNVVILILESFGREYIGAYNEQLKGGKYEGYTPFVDSLYRHSLSFDYTFCNGRKSIDGMPSILSSIPMFVEPFVLTPASMNRVSGIAGELGKVGYSSAFFHGAENGSMGFQAFARTSGFERYYGRTEYNQDKRFNGDADFDGLWAIWDEEFLQYYALQMSELPEPFVTAVFTATSHHPYAVPERYQDIYPDLDPNPIHKCIRYVDHALEQFFATAAKQPWFENTIFVLTSDHTNLSDFAEYQTDLGGFGSPILFYDPSGRIEPGRRHCIAQQIDIMPSLLGHLGYKSPYVGFGQDLFHTDDADTWAVNFNNGIYQYVKGDYLLQFDGEQTKALYNIREDWMLTRNLVNTLPDVQQPMEQAVRAIVQSYMTRMERDQLIFSE